MRHYKEPWPSLSAFWGLMLATFATQAVALEPDKLFRKVSPSVVVVIAMDDSGKLVAQGSGVVVASGEVTTNCHVLKPGTQYQVKQGELAWPAILMRGNTDHDLCVLSAPTLTAPAVSVRGVQGVHVGTRVYAIGAPRGLELTLSEGLVSSLRPLGDSFVVQTNAAISPGSSGGGLFDAEGMLIGITTFYLAEGQNLNFAMPADWIASLPKIAALAKTGKERALAWLAQRVALQEKKDWAGLLAHAQRWLKTEPDNTVAHVALGLAYAGLKQFQKAVEAHRSALRINPKYAEAWNALGAAYDDLKQYSQAVEAYRSALRFDPEYAGAWNNLGLTYDHLKQYSQAINAYRSALRINPKLAEAWTNLGFTYHHLEQYSQALDAFRSALHLNPEDANAWDGLGLAYMNLEQFAQAVDAFRIAVRINPEESVAWFHLRSCIWTSWPKRPSPGVLQAVAPPRSGQGGRAVQLPRTGGEINETYPQCVCCHRTEP